MIVVVGGGGMGKTTLVSQFLHTTIDQSSENHDKNHCDEQSDDQSDDQSQ